MYAPAYYRVTDPATLIPFMIERDFATFITHDGERPVASHLLTEILRDDESVIIRSHMSRANPQWKSLAAREALVIFGGPHTYISPRWYDHVNVPTWNYQVVHAYGIPEIVSDDAQTRAHLKSIVDRYEKSAGDYSLEKLPEEFVRKEMKGLVVFQLRLTRLEASFKLSQNRNERDHANIIEELHQRPDEASRAIAEAMLEHNPHKK